MNRYARRSDAEAPYPVREDDQQTHRPQQPELHRLFGRPDRTHRPGPVRQSADDQDRRKNTVEAVCVVVLVMVGDEHGGLACGEFLEPADH